MQQNSHRILVIKLSALGDFIQALGAMAAIRRHHAGDHITLLTTKPYADLAHKSGYFDAVLIDKRPRWLDVLGWLYLRRTLNAAQFKRVYDLQTNDRTSLYHKLLSPRPEWVGVAKGASHRNTSPQRTAGHALDGHAQTLALAGVNGVEVDPMDWMKADISKLGLRAPYVLMVPGSSPQHPQKRWPADNYAALACDLAAKGMQPVVVGAQQETDLAVVIKQACPQALDLCGKTSLEQIVVMARGAQGAVGNDTGPMHMIAATGCPSLTLFSDHSMPQRHAPKGKKAAHLQQDNLSDLAVDRVREKLSAIV